MTACLQKTLLLYAPVLLAVMAINCAWSQEHTDPYGSGGHSLSRSSNMDDIDATDAMAHRSSSSTTDDYESDAPSVESSVRHNKRRRNHKMLNNYNRDGHGNGMDMDNDLALWINEEQVKMLSGFLIKVYAIAGGRVSYYVKDPRINQHIPTIPSEVHSVNFTWRSGTRKYYYNFDRLQSLDETILKPPTVSIKVQGKVPEESRQFNVALPCAANASGTAMFSIGLLITRRGKPVPGTPIRLSLKKECAPRAPDPECDKTCANHGWCNAEKICQCPQGYMGQHCQTVLCFPQCMHGGNCTAPGKCSCPPGYQGKHCEGGICTEKCLNGGKCNQKDKCHCPKGYYGLRCEFSKCVIPCMHGGKCVGNNKCRCPAGLGGNHCEIGRHQRSPCKKPCRHGTCGPTGQCQCYAGWFGRLCNQRLDKHAAKGADTT